MLYQKVMLRVYDTSLIVWFIVSYRVDDKLLLSYSINDSWILCSFFMSYC